MPPQPLYPAIPWLTQPDLTPGALDWALGALWALVLLVGAWRARRILAGGQAQGARWVVPLLALHLLMGVLQGYPMRQLSPSHGDTLELYRSARHLWHHGWQHPADLAPLVWRRWATPADERLIDRTRCDQGGAYGRHVGGNYITLVDNRQAWRLVLVLAVLLLLAGGAYYPLALFSSALGAWACWAFAQVLLRRLPAAGLPAWAPHALRAVVLLSPAVLVWGSGLLKEPWVLAGLAAALCLADALARAQRLRPLAAVAYVLLLVLALRVKPYPVVAWLAVLGAWVLLARLQQAAGPAARRAWALGLALYALVAGGVAFQRGPMWLFEAATSRLYLLKTIRGQAPGGTWVDIGSYSPTLAGAALRAPAALRVGLIGPWPTEVRSRALALLAAEALVVLVAALLLLAAIRWRRAGPALAREPLVAALLLYAVGYAIVLGLSVSNFGSLARYRVVCIPPLLGGLALWAALSRAAEPASRLTSPLNSSMRRVAPAILPPAAG